MSDLFDNARSKAAKGLKLKPLETISLEGPCIDNQKRLNAFNRAIDDADQDLQALTATISAQGARIAELEEFVKRVDMGEYKNYINIMLAANHLKEAQS